MPVSQRNSYSFKEGLTMMAAKAIGVDPYLAAEGGENARAAINAIRNAAKTKTPKERLGYIRDAQNELRSISAAQHPKLVNALQAKLLALQGRGGDTRVAHVTPGEMVIPHAMLTPVVMRMIESEAHRRGIDPRRLLVGKGSINPATGEEEFGLLGDAWDWAKNKYREWKGEPNTSVTVEPYEPPATIDQEPKIIPIPPDLTQKSCDPKHYEKAQEMIERHNQLMHRRTELNNYLIHKPDAREQQREYDQLNKELNDPIYKAQMSNWVQYVPDYAKHCMTSS